MYYDPKTNKFTSQQINSIHFSDRNHIILHFKSFTVFKSIYLNVISVNLILKLFIYLHVAQN